MAEHARGIEQLKASAQPFTPAYVSEVAGVSVDQIREVVSIFTSAKRGSLVTGTGPHFALHGTLLEYLALCINTLCGRWVREGERNGHPHVMLPHYQPKAQPMAPYKPWDETKPGRLYGLPKTIMGAATGTLADEILTPGKGQIRALICAGSNPMVSLPDQNRTLKAFKSLDLEKYGLKSGDLIRIRSAYGEINGIAAAEDRLRPGTLSMSHCFGANPDEQSDPENQGACTARLLTADEDHIDPLFGQPRMGAIPVAISLLS